MMPTKIADHLQYLVTAVADSVKIHIPALEGGSFTKDNTKWPVYFKGKSAVVFAFQLQKKSKAIKIWPAPVSADFRNRYLLVEKFIEKSTLSYFADSAYLKDAITLKDQVYDVLLMDWTGRQTVKEYIISNIDQKEKLHALAGKILRMHLDLNQAGVAHGHLHTGNIYIDANNELRLIDYDCLFIKDRMEPAEYPQPYPDYCHPASSVTASLNQYTDYFAALIIYLGIKAIAYDAILWGRFKIGFNEGFLFTASDFTDIKNAPAYKYLRKNHSPETDKLLDILLKYYEEADPSSLKPFYTYLEKDLSIQPSAADNSKKPVRESTVKITRASEIENHQHITIPAIIAPAVMQATETNESTAQLPHVPVIEASIPAFENTTDPEQSAAEPIVLIPPNRKSAIRKTHYDVPLKKQKKRFLLAMAVVCATILAASYLLGEFADNANDYHFKPDAQAITKPAEPAKKTAPAPATIKTDSVRPVLPVTNNAVAIKHEEKKQLFDSVKNIQAINDDPVAKVTVSRYHDTPAENTAVATNEKSITLPVVKPASKKINTIKK